MASSGVVGQWKDPSFILAARKDIPLQEQIRCTAATRENGMALYLLVRKVRLLPLPGKWDSFRSRSSNATI